MPATPTVAEQIQQAIAELEVEIIPYRAHDACYLEVRLLSAGKLVSSFSHILDPYLAPTLAEPPSGT